MLVFNRMQAVDLGNISHSMNGLNLTDKWQSNCKKKGIAVMFLDNFSGRNVISTY